MIGEGNIEGRKRDEGVKGEREMREERVIGKRKEEKMREL